MILYALLLFILDAVVAICFAVSLWVALGLIVLFVRFVGDERRLRRGVTEPGCPAIKGDVPHVLVQLPVFNEPAVVENVLRTAAALDWPRDRLTI